MIPTAEDALRIWEHPAHAHWRGASGSAWWSDWGAKHRKMLDYGGGAVLEWGVGGGANAVTFPGVRYEAVDISEASLREAQIQAPWITTHKVDPIYPAFDIEPVTAFLCTTVIQHMASADVVERMAELVSGLVSSGGSGLVQCRTDAGPEDSVEGSWHRWTTYTPGAFRALWERHGWTVTSDTREAPDYVYLGLVRNA